MQLAKNPQNRPMLQGVIQKIKVAHFLLRHSVVRKDSSYHNAAAVKRQQ